MKRVSSVGGFVHRLLMILGAGGQVGRFLAIEAVRRGHDASAFARKQLDITDVIGLLPHETSHAC